MTQHHVTIERAAPEDAEALTALQIAAFNDDFRLYPGVAFGGPPGHDEVRVTLAKIQQEDTYKILYDGQIVGGLVVVKQREGHYHLDILYIDPAFHSLGIGSRAMQFIEQTYDATLWTLNTPIYATRNRHFYEKLGYMNVGKDVYEEITLIAYEKRV